MIVRAASPVRLFRPSPREYKWIRIEPNRPPGVRDDAKVVAQASRTLSLRRKNGPAGPTAKVAVLRGSPLSGQNLMEGGQKRFHLTLFADGQAHVIWQCRK